MTEHNENIKTLLELIKENPKLPIVPMVDSEICGDGYGRWSGAWGAARVDKYIVADIGWDSRIIFESDGDILETLEGYLTDDEFEKLPDNETELQKAYDNLPWIKAIIVDINVDLEQE